MIDTIYDEEKLKRVLSCRKDITSEYMSINEDAAKSELVHFVRRDLANRISHFILEDKKFFNYVVDKYFVGITAEVVVLTKEEYRSDIKEAYEKGMRRMNYNTYNFK